MRLSDYAKRLLGLAETLSTWAQYARVLDDVRRTKVARYATQVADTLARAATALEQLKADPRDGRALAGAVREFGRISGYLETIVDVMRHHLDGRKLSGVKRRLEQLDEPNRDALGGAGALHLQIDRLTAAEGFFRALADGLVA